jgi:HD-like signal output (HDOD) protein
MHVSCEAKRPKIRREKTHAAANSKRLAEILGDSDLPPISSIAAQLVETLSEDQVDLTYLRDLIAQDPSLSQRHQTRPIRASNAARGSGRLNK